MTVRRVLFVALVLVSAVAVGAGIVVARDPGVLLRTAAAYERGKADLATTTWSWRGHDIVALEGGAPVFRS